MTDTKKPPREMFIDLDENDAFDIQNACLIGIAKPDWAKKLVHFREVTAEPQVRERKFPIQPERSAKPHPTSIPWHVADLAFSVYSAKYGKSQSLEKLAERGGFYPSEMDDFLPDWRERANPTQASGEVVCQCADDVQILKAELAAKNAEIEELNMKIAGDSQTIIKIRHQIQDFENELLDEKAKVGKLRKAAMKQGLKCANTGVYGQLGIGPGECKCGNCEMKKALEETKES